MDKTKQKELKEYLRVQYKGDLPDHLRGTVDDSDTDRNYDRHGDRDYPPTGARGGNNRSNNNYDSDNHNGSQRDRSRSNNINRGRVSGNDSDYDDDRGGRRSVDLDGDSGDERDRRRGDRDSDRGGRGGDTGRVDKRGKQGQGRGHQDKEGRWVSEQEYEELTALCDRLMSQQDRLQDEIQHQAGLIKVTAVPILGLF